ncbi:hypothetical protein L1787_05490 [Acuticoccus sp. M5D2P5]|uniref:hypothetical protein n=1 Tax=Acuticoccus kalidii TaxID=2910977 RepID=UPI001F371F2F|nr:hypothetical protein [Acuticoccus kalidii]MCF3932867.1 hypothetical protein [Acuticoccus kalidii]
MGAKVKAYGRLDLLEASWNLSEFCCKKIASIITMSGSIEYYAERSIWTLENIEPRGQRPNTDAKQITELIGRIEGVAAQKSGNERELLKLWCDGAYSAFIVRNNICHGVAVKLGGSIAFMRNPQWHGEMRRREFGDFWVDENSLDLVADSFASLLRVISGIECAKLTLNEVATPAALRALSEARSILGEFGSRDYNPGFEKY